MLFSQALGQTRTATASIGTGRIMTAGSLPLVLAGKTLSQQAAAIIITKIKPVSVQRTQARRIALRMLILYTQAICRLTILRV